jgi:hypothetical protein
MGIETKTLGFLIDELITTDLKCWFSQEALMDKSLTEGERLQAAIRTQETNSRRNQLIRAIDELMGQGANSVTTKTYTKHFEQKAN